ncbi:MAG TPA: glycosyltransferase family 4 protein [Bacteroidia bacterium]|nr:glycosyltransferase family 4 protein [Bacteroidia bacterium]HNP99969.1 glycosyltransferase family 4 protein [Bacteroidia bacterium]
MAKEKLLFFYIGKSTFVKKDIEIFTSNFDVKCYDFKFERKWKTPFQMLHQLFFILIEIRRTKIIVCQLSGYHAFFPALIGKLANVPSIIIAAGTDCHSFPEIHYGNFQKKILSFFTKCSFVLCTHISPKHQTLWESDYTYDNVLYKKQGIKSFIPNLKDKFTVITNGFESAATPTDPKKIKKTFVTAAGLLQFEYQRKLKGIDLILDVAPKLPDYTFHIVGAGKHTGIKSPSKNVVLHPPLSLSELTHLMSISEYYLQLSMAEGFPNSLCEAMICECIPIGANVFSIPEIIGNTGFILSRRDSVLLYNMLRSLPAEINIDSGRKARNRILNLYSLEKRKNSLLNLLNKLKKK